MSLPTAQILIMQQRTVVTETITFADDAESIEETATGLDDRWMCNFLTFPGR